MDILAFIFSSFWHFAGTILLLATLSEGVANAVRAFHRRD